MKSYYFLSVNVSKANGGTAMKLRPLSGQFFEETGEPVIDGYNVQGNLEPTGFNGDQKTPEYKKYPVGSIFVSNTLVLGKALATGKDGKAPTPYYSTTEPLRFVEAPDGATEPIVPSHAATESDRMDWEVYKSKATGGFKSAKKAERVLDKINNDKRFACPNIAQHGFFVEEQTWKFFLSGIMKSRNIMLVGPTGTGKTEICYLAAERLGMPIHVFDMGQMGKDTLSGICGVHRISPDGHSYFDKSEFSEVIQHPGIVVLDELTRAQELNVLFPLLDNRRELQLFQAGSVEERTIKVHPECVFVATANIGANFTGTFALDEALENRFTVIEVNYLTKENEARLIEARTGIATAEAVTIANVCEKIRRLYANDEISKSISTRKALAVAESVADGFSVREALELHVPVNYEGNRMEGERNIIYGVIASV